jgi:hypothetical protein
MAKTVVIPQKRRYAGPGTREPLVAAFVETVRVLVTAAVPVALTAVGEREQPGMSLTFVMPVVTAQVKFTAPVNPFEGVRLIVEVLALVAPAVT